MNKQEVVTTYGSLALAYIGDAAYELYVRNRVLRAGITDNGKMHLKTRSFVSSHAQCAFLHALMPVLSQDEQQVVRRGRNVKSRSHPKNADIAEYHDATGFEALWGYLYLADDT